MKGCNLPNAYSYDDNPIFCKVLPGSWVIGDTYRFGFLAPSSFDPIVSTGGDKSLIVKDCGRNNRVTGSATLVDTTIDPWL